MKKTYYPNRKVGLVLVSSLAVVLAGCTTYVERPAPHTLYVPQPPPPVVYEPDAEAPVVVIQAESDFYGPLSPYGEWIDVPGYGRCWRPAQVDTTWRPYSNGHWQQTDAGWYWVSDEPWAWATYHYGRWDLTGQFGWVWVPQTQWAPAWVSWREGGGYFGWAPLPPSASFAANGSLEVHEAAISPQGFVFVQERQILAPVRSQTVIVNHTTIINQTINITSVKMVNHIVRNEGPRVAEVERVSGHKLQTIRVNQLRHQEETEAAARWRKAPQANEQTVRAPAHYEVVQGKTVSQHELPHQENQMSKSSRPQPTTVRNDGPESGSQNLPSQTTPSKAGNPVHYQTQQVTASQHTQPTSGPQEVRPTQTRRETKSAPATSPRTKAPTTRQTESHPQPQTVTTRNRTVGPPSQTNPNALKKGAQVHAEKMSKPLKIKPTTARQSGTNAVNETGHKGAEQSSGRDDSRNPHRQ